MKHNKYQIVFQQQQGSNTNVFIDLFIPNGERSPNAWCDRCDWYRYRYWLSIKLFNLLGDSSKLVFRLNRDVHRMRCKRQSITESVAIFVKTHKKYKNNKYFQWFISFNWTNSDTTERNTTSNTLIFPDFSLFLDSVRQIGITFANILI